MEAFGFFTVGAGLLLLLSFCRGLCLSYFWLWFIQPLGENIPEISIAHGVGISILATHFFGPMKLKDLKEIQELRQWKKMQTDLENKERRLMLQQMFVMSCVSLFALGCGWIITLFM